MLLPFACFSQAGTWTLKTHAPTFRHLKAVQILPNGRIVAAGGHFYNDAITSLYYSDDSASTWAIVADGINAMMNGLHFPTATTGYTVGNAGQLFKSIDAGQSWQSLPLTGSIASRNYNGVYFSDANTGIAVGGNQSNDSIQTIIRTTDGGATWNIVSDNLGSWLLNVTFPDANHGYAVGEMGKILKTIDGGVNWTTVTVPAGLATRQFHDAYFFNALTGIVVGGNAANDSIQTIIKTTDGGATWNIISDNIASMLNAVHFYNSTQGYVTGDDGVIKYTNDQGNTWNSLTIAGNDGSALYDVFMLNSAYGITSGEYGKTLIYKDASLNAPTANIVTPVTILSGSSAQINGLVNYDGAVTSVSFEYGTTLSFGTTVSMAPASVSVNGQSVSVNVTGLSPAFTYYGRIKVSNSIGTTYSTTATFTTNMGAAPTAVITTPIGIINSNTAYVQGLVDAHGNSTTIEFEYGTTLSFGTLAPMSPSNTLSSAEAATLTLTGLSPTSIYYGRIKVVNISGTAYSSTVQFSTNTSVVPNFNFELWNSFSYNVLGNWNTAGTVTQVLSYDGSYAAHAQGNGGSPGAVLYADANGSGINPLPYSGGRPDSLIVYAKYDEDVSDSAVIFISFNNGATAISNDMKTLGGSSGGLFQRIAMKINYTDSSTPDGLTLLMLSTNYFAGMNSLTSQLSVDNVQLTGGVTQLPNSNMESWSIAGRNQAVSWWSEDDSHWSPGDSAIISRSTDAYDGNYALLLRNDTTNNQFGFITTNNGFGSPTPSFPVSFRHESLNGYYKFQQDDNDTLWVNVEMFSAGSQIGSGYSQIANSTVSSYQPFSVPINYFGGTTPDSSSISVMIRKGNGMVSHPGASYALIDDLTFDGLVQTLSVDDLSKTVSYNVFPNPVQNDLSVALKNFDMLQGKTVQVSITDLMGRTVKTEVIEAKELFQIDVSSLTPQLYILRLSVDGHSFNSRFIKN